MSKPMSASLDTFALRSDFVTALPGDPSTVNQPRQVVRACYSRVDPTPVRAPALLATSPALVRALGLHQVESSVLAEWLGGNRTVAGSLPYAACYGGHQFGNWAGQLGDGRAITLGEATGSSGERLELQLKGAGLTPYSRTADGRAVLRSSIREFLCSEAMHHLGIPTTRALSLVTTGEGVMRDILYDGHPRSEPGAVVCRVAPSFIRFGNFEIFASRGDNENLERLAAYTLSRFFPELGPASKESYGALLLTVAERTAELIAHWMRVGFVHGVMNTDNMSILGLTLDYGPYGWLDNYDPNWTPNTTDRSTRRYRYAYQPVIGLWNLARLCEAFYPLVQNEAPLEAALDHYQAVFLRAHRRHWLSKLGLPDVSTAPSAPQQGQVLGVHFEDPLLDDLRALLVTAEIDFNLFFHGLAAVPVLSDNVDPARSLEPLRDAYYDPEVLNAAGQGSSHADALLAWLRRYQARLTEAGVAEPDRLARMGRTNPLYVLRNYCAQLAIDQAETGDPSLVLELLNLIERPYEYQPGRDRWLAKRPDWARSRPGCSQLSCSS
jgi:serine/tyrosine/threonine adenylyltransferase